MSEKYISTTQLAEILGISRVAVFNKIKKGEIKARKVGRNYIIAEKDLGGVLGQVTSEEKRKEIEKAVERTIEDYGETLRLLGSE